MNLFRILALGTFFLFLNLANAQISDWVHGIDTSYRINSVITDDSGFVYICGSKTSLNWHSVQCNTVEFNGQRYTSPNISQYYGTSVFLMKIDSNGNMIWAKILGSYDQIWDGQLTIDNNGDLIARFPFVTNIKIEGDTNIFPIIDPQPSCLIKFSSSGQFKWARISKGKWYNNYFNEDRIRIDQHNNIYTGHENMVFVYDTHGNQLRSYPVLNSYDFALDSLKRLYAVGYSLDTLLQVYDSNGLIIHTVRFSWLGNFGGYGIEFDEIQIDDDGNIYIHGRNLALTNFILGTDSLENPWSVLIKLDPQLNLIWMKNLGKPNSGSGDHFQLELLGSNYIFTSGEVQLHTFSFDSINWVLDTSKIIANSNYAYQVMKLDSNGNFIWTKFAFGGGMHRGNCATSKNNVYCIFTTTNDSIEVDGVTSGPGRGYLMKIIDGTNKIKGKVFIDSNSNHLPDLGDSLLNNQVVQINGKYDFRTNLYGEYTAYVPSGNYDIKYSVPYSGYIVNPDSNDATFISSFQQDTANNFELIKVLDTTIFIAEETSLSVSVFPNPCQDHVLIKGDKEALKNIHFTVYDQKGQLISSGHININEGRSRIPLKDVSPGVYILNLNSNDGSKNFRLSIQ